MALRSISLDIDQILRDLSLLGFRGYFKLSHFTTGTGWTPEQVNQALLDLVQANRIVFLSQEEDPVFSLTPSWLKHILPE